MPLVPKSGTYTSFTSHMTTSLQDQPSRHLRHLSRRDHSTHGPDTVPTEQFAHSMMAAESSAARAAFDALRADKLSAAIRLRRKARFVALGIVAACVAGYIAVPLDIWGFIGFLPFFLFAFSFLGVPTANLSLAEYRSIPGVVRTDSCIACVGCGHVGVFRNASHDKVVARCSRCETVLWTSPRSGEQ